MSLNVAKDSLSELMSPGERISSVYNSEENCHVFKDKTTFTNRFVYNLTNLQMNGQQIQINIPNDGLFNYLYLALSFPTVASTTGVSVGLVPLAAYSILQQIQEQLFGSTIYQSDGIQAMHSVYSDCQTKEQMDELILLGGGAGAAGEFGSRRRALRCHHHQTRGLGYCLIGVWVFERNRRGVE